MPTLSCRARFTPRDAAGRFIPAVVSPGVKASVAASVAWIRDTAKQKAAVRSGDLRDSIEATAPRESGATVTASVTVGVPYGPYVEFGTGVRGASSPDAGKGPYNPNWPGMAPQPYLRPAIEEFRQIGLDLWRSNISIAM